MSRQQCILMARCMFNFQVCWGEGKLMDGLAERDRARLSGNQDTHPCPKPVPSLPAHTCNINNTELAAKLLGSAANCLIGPWSSFIEVLSVAQVGSGASRRETGLSRPSKSNITAVCKAKPNPVVRVVHHTCTLVPE